MDTREPTDRGYLGMLHACAEKDRAQRGAQWFAFKFVVGLAGAVFALIGIVRFLAGY